MARIGRGEALKNPCSNLLANACRFPQLVSALDDEQQSASNCNVAAL